ncbi:MAG: MG2 domain-containing protein [Verrucomicrobiota bacterium]|nr:MG2 domain-containing protein [Verrucomicrobiota bacterium]
MNRERFEELLGLLLDEEITGKQLEELAQIVNEDAGCLEELRCQLVTADQLSQYEDEQRLAEVFIEGLKTRLGATEGSEKFVEQVMETVQDSQADASDKIIEVVPVEPQAGWMWGGRFWAIAATVVLLLCVSVGLKTQQINQLKAKPEQAFLIAPEDLAPGAPAAFRVFVRNGQNTEPVAKAEVEVSLTSAEGDEVWMVSATTDESGFANIEKQIPDELAEGEYKVVAQLAGDDQSVITQNVQLTRSYRVMVTTDKPLYQPGQSIHIRSLSLANADMRPVGGRKTVIEVQDAKGNKVFKKVGKTSDFGIFSADFVLADQVNIGSYTISAIVGDTTSERTVTVERYKLPKFKIDLSIDKGFYLPGQMVSGTVSAQYTFGKPVAGGKIKITASEFIERLRPFEIIEGELDEEGNFPFEFRLKGDFVGSELNQGDASVSLQAEVVDLADHKQERNRNLIVTTRPIRMDVFPESGTLVQNVENILYVVTAYPDGRPAKANVMLSWEGKRLEVKTSEVGIAKVKITPDKPNLRMRISAEDEKGVKAAVVRKLRIDRRTDAFLLRTDQAVYKTGDTVQLDVFAPGNKERIFVDVIKNRRAVLMKSVDIEQGKGALALDLPADLFGTLELRGYRIQRDGNIIGDTKVIQVKRADSLKIEAKLDKETYQPGEKALLSFVVKRADGKGVPAALGLSGVDEAVFALQEMRPGLERIYFAIQEEILKPRYQLHTQPPVQVQQLIEPGPAPMPEPDLEEAAVVLFAGAEGTDIPEANVGPGFERKRQLVRERKRAHKHWLQQLVVLSPFVIFILLTLPILGYGILKFIRRQPIEGSGDEQLAFKKATDGLMLWWVLGINIPIVIGVLSAVIANATRNDAVGFTFLGFALFTLVAVFVLLILSVIKLRKSETTQSLPLLRKVVLAVPAVYLLWALYLVAIIIGGQENVIGDKTVKITLLVVFGLLALIGGAISIARNCAMHEVSSGRMVWLGMSRTCLSGPSCILLFLMILMVAGGSMGARNDMMADGMEMNMAVNEMAMDGDRPDFAEGMPNAEKLEETTEEAPGGKDAVGSNLKAPTRIRRYFPETLLWKPELITDEQGRAKLEVPLADSITTWRLAMSAVSKGGGLGSATTGIRVFQDFFVDIDFPVALTQNDQVSVPVAVYNYLDKPQTIRLEVQEGPWFELLDDPTKTLEIGAGEVTRVYFTLKAVKPGSHALTLKAFGSELADAVERRVRVEPDGKRFEQIMNGRLDENLAQQIEFPAEAIEGANDLYVKIYPGAFSQVVEGLDGIFQMPHGCFEQTSSATYPNILVLDYMRRNKQIKPEIEMKALNFINIGYQRLLSYEVKGGGFEWFGKAPAHNVLTAYGLMEFSDMAKVYDVDPKVIERTRDWLYGQQKGDGSWKPDQGGIAEGAINAFQGATLRTTAYIAWALAESGQKDNRLNRALDYILENADREKDNYTLGLCANALVAAERSEAKEFINRLEKAKSKEKELVYWGSDSQGVTFGRGNTLAIETTAIIAHAFLKASQHTSVAHKALEWLVDKKDSRGTWHSTQATVHAMRALLAGTEGGGGSDKDLSIALIANGKAAKQIEITAETSDVFRLISLRHLVKEGDNTVALEPSGEGNLAYQIVAVHYLPWQEEPLPENQPLTIDVTYDAKTLKVDDTLGVKVKLEYHRNDVADMTLVDLGIPPGFAVMPEYFQGLKDEGIIEKYSMNGRQVTLYFREISSEQPIEFSYELKAKFPVKAKTPKSTAYQYYEPEIRAEAQPVEIEVAKVASTD